jgi:microcystin-dependent protein
MSSPFLAEIRIWACNFAPKGWAMCNGQLLPISSNTALFSLLGTMYGGNGVSIFALPNFEGNVPIHQGQGPGLSGYVVGQQGGVAHVTLLSSEMPLHNHFVNADSGTATTSTPAARVYMKSQAVNQGVTSLVAIYTTTAPNTLLSNSALSITGGNSPHNNMMHFLTLNFCIAMQGIFPARN